MSLHIAVCDDEYTERLYLQSLLTDWAQERGQQIHVDEYDCAERFLLSLDEDVHTDILLLDIQMQDMDGVSLARRLREDSSSIQIVFITGYPDFIAEGYEVSALHYLMKPVDKYKLNSVLDRACDNVRRTGAPLFIETDSDIVRIPVKDILWCESFGHTVSIIAEKEKYEAKINLSELESQLGSSFIRCHRSYLVGLRHISRITRTDVILDGGKVVPLSRRLYTAVNQAFIRYFKEVR